MICCIRHYNIPCYNSNGTFRKILGTNELYQGTLSYEQINLLDETNDCQTYHENYTLDDCYDQETAKYFMQNYNCVKPETKLFFENTIVCKNSAIGKVVSKGMRAKLKWDFHSICTLSCKFSKVIKFFAN